ncbi:ATPase synthesis protein 25 mitochondrial [Spathaspora sp. JA1]|nr:ATPase synthesis protein 25 mitochondrial [Spathaspora sp. JA1]
MLSRIQIKGYVSRIRPSGSVIPRLYSRNSHIDSSPTNTEENTKTESKEEENIEHDSSLPWYLREDVASQTRTVEVELPEIPEHAPKTLQQFLELIGKEYGIIDLELYDLSTLPEEHPYSTINQPFNYIIIGSGKSEKHIFKAASELRLWIKQHHGYLPAMEGRVSNALTALARRRLAKRAGKGPSATENEFGLGKNSWVMCDTKIDGIVIHMLTPDRRENLKLESLWAEDQPEVVDESGLDGDSIFRGFRRRFHTSARGLNQQKLQGIYELLLAQETTENVEKLKEEFDSDFSGSNIAEYNIKYDFYKSLHLLDPNSITEQELIQIIWDKYSSLSLVCEDWKQEITQDVIKYMGFLLDTTTTESYNKLSQFISKIIQFSPHEINLISNPEFQNLLWKLSYTGSNEVDSSVINQIIETGKSPDVTYTDYLTQNNHQARDVTTFIEQQETPIWFRETKMLTYGNCGKWREFWNEWDIIIQTIPSKDAINYWVKLLVFLSERNTVEQLRKFFVEYWNQPGYSFVEYTKNGERFNSKEKQAVKQAIKKLEIECADFPWFKQALEFASKL